MERILDTSLRTLIGFIVLLVLIRLLGKKQLGQSTYFTYITGIAMGNIAGDMVVHRDIKLSDGITGLTLWAVLTFLVEYISLKSAKARTVLDGEPSIIIKKGQIMHQIMKSHRLNMDDLTMLLRSNNVFHIKDVDYAILEPNGQLSIMKKAELDPVTKKDMKINVEVPKYIPTEVIVDGKLVAKNLVNNGFTENWLKEEINRQGFSSFKEISYAELEADGSILIFPYK